MEWKDFVAQWRPIEMIRLGVPERTAYSWREGKSEPVGYQRAAIEFWLRTKLGEPKPKKPKSAD